MKVVIIGNGVAGIWTASILAGSPDVKVEVLTEEDYLYYTFSNISLGGLNLTMSSFTRRNGIPRRGSK